MLSARPLCLLSCRLLTAYRARIADEGEYDESELPGDLVDELEGAAGPAQQTFAVRGTITSRLGMRNARQ